MSVLSWGKPKLFIQKIGEESASWKELPTPVEDSTQLSTTKGDKVEAKVEGGENEDVRYGKNTYALAFNIRAAKNRKKPVPDSDGIIDGEYKVALQPEDPDTPGLMIEKAKLSIEDTWSSADGGLWAYTADALKPENGKQVKWGKVAVSNTGTVTFTEDTDAV